MSIHVSLSLSLSLYIIYIEREREREREIGSVGTERFALGQLGSAVQALHACSQFSKARSGKVRSGPRRSELSKGILKRR